MKKTYRVQYKVGKARYLVSFYDGVKTHKDGSPFFDACIFSNKAKMRAFTKMLEENGYIEA